MSPANAKRPLNLEISSNLVGFKTNWAFDLDPFFPLQADGIDKDLVFKLQYKTHVYFFRAENEYTFYRCSKTY